MYNNEKEIMMSVRRMLPFLLLNIVVSAVVSLAILYFWDNRSPQTDGVTAAEETAVAAQPIANANPLAQPAIPPTETPEPDEGPTVHIVKAGDTLGIISNIYSVPMDDIIAANNLANPNILSVGQELVIPLDGLATAVPEAEPTAMPETNVLPTPIATEPITVGNDVAVEITAVIAPGQLEDEAVQIRNTGADPVALLGWKLADRDGRFYTFGQITLFGGSVDILVHSKAGQNGPTDFYWGQTEPVWSPGELVTLLDAEDNIIATFTVP